MKYLILLLAILTIQSCINLKSKYPEIKYFNLEQKFLPPKLTEQIKGILQVRDFTINGENDTEYLIAIQQDSKVQRYYYYRWISDFTDLATDFFVKKFENDKLFSGGIIKSGSMIIPDYILECQIIDMSAYNSENQPNANLVSLSMKFNLIRREKSKTIQDIVLSQTYTVKKSRPDNSASNIADAYSKAINEITELLTRDIKIILEK